MMKSKEYKTSIVFSIAALVLYAISMITGLIPGLVYSVDKICMYLGFACFCMALTGLYKSKDKKESEE